jgi:small-conductance mechanosensitive channel
VKRLGLSLSTLALVFAILAAPGLCAQTAAPGPPPRPAPAAPAIPPRPAVLAPNNAESPAPIDSAARIDAAKQSLDQIEAALATQALSDADLTDRQAAIGPVQKQIQAAVADLAPKLAAIKARMDQLGPPHDPKTNPTPEDPAIAEDRAEQNKLYVAADDLNKRANLLQVRADQLSDQITARRRALFADAVFQQESSILAPKLWLDVAREAPRGAAAASAAVAGFVSRVQSVLRGGATLPFLSLLALLIAALAGLIFGARRVIPRADSHRKPNDLQKAVAALWTLFAVSAIPIAGISALYKLAGWFGLNDPQMQPVDSALFWGVVRCSVASGLTTAIFAPKRELWRPIAMNDLAAQKLRRLVITVAVVISVGKLIEAINEVIGASLEASMATRGAYAFVVGIILARGLSRVVAAATSESEDPRSGLAKPVAESHDALWSAIRLAVWFAVAAILIADLSGYIALSAFIAGQLAWVSFIGGVLFLLTTLTSEAIGEAFRPGSRFSRGLIAGVGLRRESLQQFGVLLSGVVYVALCAIAGILALAPWGVHSQDMLGAIQSAFQSVQVGEVTISLSSVVLALILFAAGVALTRALQNWLETSYLPLTQLDMGLRASIRTSVGYLGMVASLTFALAYLGINTEKLALVAGALSVGIGLGLQSVVNNFVSGLIILWERAIRVGDWIMIGSDQGYVRKISVRATEIETFDRATMIVPNGTMMTGVVKNFVRDDRVGRITIPVSVLWGAEPEKVREVLLDAAKSHEQVVGIPAPTVLFSKISAASLDFELVCFVEDVERALRVKSDLHYTIFSRFAEAGLRLNPPAAPQTLTLDLAQIEPLLQELGAAREIKT